MAHLSALVSDENVKKIYVNKLVSELLIGCYFYSRSQLYHKVMANLWRFYDHLMIARKSGPGVLHHSEFFFVRIIQSFRSQWPSFEHLEGGRSGDRKSLAGKTIKSQHNSIVDRSVYIKWCAVVGWYLFLLALGGLRGWPNAAWVGGGGLLRRVWRQRRKLRVAARTHTHCVSKNNAHHIFISNNSTKNEPILKKCLVYRITRKRHIRKL